MSKRILFALLPILFSGSVTAAPASPTVLELFTSQGCSSCPPADALLKQLSAADPTLLPLSFHVHYWDNLGWKDPFSAPAYTARQQAYAATLGSDQVFTPQLIVNGDTSVVGSRTADVTAAIAAAKKAPLSLLVTLQPDSTGKLRLIIAADTPAHVDIWEIRYRRTAVTPVQAGENSGHALTNINSVTALTHIGAWPGLAQPYMLDTPAAGEGVAILLQTPHQGKIIAAADFSGS